MRYGAAVARGLSARGDVGLGQAVTGCGKRGWDRCRVRGLGGALIAVGEVWHWSRYYVKRWRERLARLDASAGGGRGFMLCAVEGGGSEEHAGL